MPEDTDSRVLLTDQLIQGVEQLLAARSLPVIYERLLAITLIYSGAREGAAVMNRGDGVTEVVAERGLGAALVGRSLRELRVLAPSLTYRAIIGEADEPVGFLLLGGLPDDPHKMDEKPHLRMLLSMGASVISSVLSHEESQLLNERLNQRLQELRALLDFGRGLTSTLDVEEIVQLLALTLAGRWAISRYAVHVWREGHDDVFRGRGFTFAQVEALSGRYKDLSEAILLGEDNELEWLRQLGVPPGSMLIPLLSNEQMIGVILCGLRLRNQHYSREDKEFGLTLASRAAGSIENAWFFKEALVSREMERELTLAASIQQDLFPKNMPIPKGWDVSARNRQARQVGGDYFDGMWLRLGDAGSETRKVLYVVADVAGKGIGSALLMANIQATLRALLHHEPSLESIATEANSLLFASTPSNRYATAFLLLLDPSTGEADFVNCAHNNPLLLRANQEVEFLDGPGLALGMMARSTQSQVRVAISVGDILVIYTDGVSEAMNVRDEEFGVDRLRDVVRKLASQSAKTIVDGIFQAIEYHVGDAPQHDDITLMVIKRTS